MKKIIMIIIIIAVIMLLLWVKILPRTYPQKYSEYVEKYAKENELDPLLIYSIIKAESNFNNEAKSNSDAIGLMQLMLSTAEEMSKKMNLGEITEEDLYNPEVNIKIGTKYFKSLLEKYDNYNLAIIAYNAGMGNVDKWIEQGILDNQGENIENIPFAETKSYAKKILQNYKIYKKIYEK